ncbi:MAG: anthranilate synthase component I family protein [Niabella sp.]
MKRFNTFCFLDSSGYSDALTSCDLLVGAGVEETFSSSSPDALQQLQEFIQQHKSWLFGHLGYGLTIPGNLVFPDKRDEISFPHTYFFEPQVVVCLNEQTLTIEAVSADEVYKAIQDIFPEHQQSKNKIPALKSRLTKDAYVQIIEELQKHIHRGDCYEINFCQEFFAENAGIDAFDVYQKLSALSPNPFSGFYRCGDKWLMCASPERFLKKMGNRIVSQPIKGTLRHNPAQTLAEREALLCSEKDRAENVMVVDLVRNDLSKVCRAGSVRVDELFGIYSFPQVHQMISTVSGELQGGVSFADIITATFPMGSMTGAPKVRVLRLIDQYEQGGRGIFSGSLGYISPTGDFDFNVVIRSLMYNGATGYLSYQTGSGITIYSHPEQEWKECLLKGEAIQQALSE